MATDSRGIRAGRAFVELGVDKNPFVRGLKAAEKHLVAFGRQVRDIGLRIAAAGGSIVGALFGAARVFATIGDALNDMSARTGVSVEALSELSHAAEQSGADVESLENGLRFMQRTLGEAAHGSKSATESLTRLGLSMGALLALSPENQFKAIADGIARIDDPTLRAAAAMDLFGKSGTRLIPMIEGGAAGLEAFQRQARDFALTLTTLDAVAASKLDDTLNLLSSTLKALVRSVGAAVAPVFTEVAQRIAQATAGTAKWVSQNRQLIVTALKVGAVVTAVGAAIAVAGTTIIGLGITLGSLATIATTVGAAIAALTSPIGLAVGSLAVLGAAVVKYTEVGAEALKWFGEQFGKLRDFIGDVLGGVRDAMLAGDIALAGRILWLTLKVAWQKGVAELNIIWMKAKTFFLEVGHKMWFGLLKSAETAWSKLRTAWVETISFMASVLVDFGSTFSIIFESFKAGAEEVGAALRGAVDDSFDWQQAIVDIDRKVGERLGVIADERGQQLADVEQRRADALQQEEQLHKGALQILRQREDEALARLREGRTTGVSKAEAELTRLRAELADAIAQARTGRPLDAGDAGAPRRLTDLLDDLPDRLDVARQAARGAAVGTFNPFAVAGLAGRATLDDLKQRMEELIKKTEETNRMLARGGLKFSY